MEPKIYISGLHSGQSPCAGLGIARSLRRAFPRLKLVGVDHWQGSSGLHDPALDERLLLPQWKQIDRDRHVAQLRSYLDEGHLWIAALDMEVHWLNRHHGPHPRLLIPGTQAVERTAKPAVDAVSEFDPFKQLGFRVPEYIPITQSDADIHAFLRQHSWQCWLKTPFHDARRISSWAVFERYRAAIRASGNPTPFFLQRHVAGNEESIAFSAYQGELLGAAYLEKRIITSEGKTWGGKVTPLDPALAEPLAQVMREIGWTGGGEIEFTRDPDGRRWIIECNPRYPAWIFGGALAGVNLPAKLVARACDLPLLESVPRFPFFTRVVQEIAAREELGMPAQPDPSASTWSGDGKKGKMDFSLPSFCAPPGDACDEPEGVERASAGAQDPEPTPPEFMAEVSEAVACHTGDTPARIHLPRWSRARFEKVAQIARARARLRPELRFGYSVKTSPTDEHLALARKLGFYAECISQMEIQRALRSGFSAGQVILNGPGKFWPITQPPAMGLHLLFCDSIEEFERVLDTPRLASGLGFRMRVPGLSSRFGNALEDFETFRRIIGCVRRIEGRAALGFHFHMPSWAIGMNRWLEALESLLLWCQSVEKLGGVEVTHLDLGGGFFPADLEALPFEKIQRMAAGALRGLEGIYFEPGRALTQDGDILVSRVLDVRRDAEGKPRELVVDACIAELPLAQAYSHRIFFASRADRECRSLGKGETRVLGRICMEDDILSAGLDFPGQIAIGDRVIFADAGAYERTMSYDFGRG